MAKALKPLVIVVLVLSIISLALGIVLFLQRGEIKDRVQKNEQAIVKIAQNLRMENLDAAVLAEQLKSVTALQTALDSVAVSAENRYEELQNTKADLETTRADLSRTKEELATTKSELAASQAEVAQLTDTLAQRDAELAQAKSQLEQLEQDKIALQTQIDDLNNQLVKSEEEIRDLQDQKATLEKIVKDMEAREGGKRLLPIGLTGHIVVVNPDWNFVVLDLGSEQGLVPSAEMLVHRGDKLIGKVRVSNVQEKAAIAEIMLDWEQEKVHEGDNVLF